MIDTNNISTLVGSNVVDSSGDKIGSVGQLYVDADSGAPTWVSVRTGLFGMSESFVPIDRAEQKGDEIRVPYTKDRVKDAPRIDVDGALDEAQEDELYAYYGNGSAGYGRTTDAGAADHHRTTDAGAADHHRTTDADGTVGHDTSGPTTDDAMTRSEERLNVGTEKVQAGRARLRKHVVTENETVTVPVTREEVRLEREPITDANVGDAMDGPAISEEEHEVVLTEERAVVTKETVPVERVRLGKESVTEQETVTEQVRKEEIELDGDADGTERR